MIEFCQNKYLIISFHWLYRVFADVTDLKVVQSEMYFK